MRTFKIIAPHFTHDCDCCTLVGQTARADVYHHGDSVIVRTGDAGPDYASLPLRIARLVDAYAVPVAMVDAYQGDTL